MPTPDEIRAVLTDISNQWWQVAACYHVTLIVLLLSPAFVRSLPRRQAAIYSVFPPLSVAFAAWSFHSPFNGLLFSLLTLALLLIARRLPLSPVARSPLWTLPFGVLLVAFGWVYPHFFYAWTPWLHLMAAPLGLVPCPTLSCLIGLSLLGGSFGSRAWGMILGAFGLFYGLFGAFRLEVRMDLILALGAVALIILAASPTTSEAGGPRISTNTP
jgi:hypothetical protein